jgi:hypothetical protein
MSTKPPVETKFDPIVASDEQIMDLYNEVFKEVTNRWKKSLSERMQIRERRNK